MLTQERLKELLHYDPLTGLFTRLVPTGGRGKVGDVAGCVKVDRNGKSYRQIVIDYKTYLAHRLAFLYMNGELPTDQVDHEDGAGLNNIWTNLRHATNQENGKNQRLQAANTSGQTGVGWHKREKKWRARIKLEGIDNHLGYFIDKDGAIAARKAAEIIHGFHPNHGQIRPL
tara:strand:- start:1852 stop:2367 length:516 start_codon:yes stop_codon:yes gene_type:complete